MAPTTLRTFVDNLEAVTFTGVSRQYTQGPPVGATADADLPATFVKLPFMSEEPLVLGEQGGWTEYHATLVYLVEPVAQNQQGPNFDAWVDAVDTVCVGMRAVTCNTLGLAKHLWSIPPSPMETVAGIQYWAVKVDVTGYG
jgi:hypothetical protein